MDAVLITGAAKRIGKALALAFADKGYAIAIHYHRSQKDAQRLSQLIKEKHNVKTCLIHADLEHITSDKASACVKQAQKDLGTPLTCLIHNASLFKEDDLERLEQNLWDAHININLRAPLFLSRAFAQELRAQKNKGNIIHLLDSKILKPNPFFLSYSLSKMALGNATILLAQDLAPQIRVNGIALGPILPSPYQSEAELHQSDRKSLLQIPTTTDDITRTALFLARQSALTGQILTLDSGRHLQ